MQEKTFDLATTINSSYIINSIFQILYIAVMIAIVYYVIKLYRKLIKFLDQNTKP